MKKLVLPVALAIVGMVGGAGAGWFLKPPPPPEPCLNEMGEEQPAEACAAPDKPEKAEKEPKPADEAEHATPSEFVEIDRQFVIPVMGAEKVIAFVLLNLNVEIDPGQTDAVVSRMPRVRDAFLRVLFDHAYAGGFDGAFTAEYVMRDLRANLRRAARKVAGPVVRDVLVTDIVRQDN